MWGLIRKMKMENIFIKWVNHDGGERQLIKKGHLEFTVCPLWFYTTVGAVASGVSGWGTGNHQAGALRRFVHVAMRRFSGDI